MHRKDMPPGVDDAEKLSQVDRALNAIAEELRNKTEPPRTVAQGWEALMTKSSPHLEKQVEEAADWVASFDEQRFDEQFFQLEEVFDREIDQYWGDDDDHAAAEYHHRPLLYLPSTSRKFYLKVRKTPKMNGQLTGRTIEYPEVFVVTEQRTVNGRLWGRVKKVKPEEEGGWVRLTQDKNLPMTHVVKCELTCANGESAKKRRRLS